MLFLHTYMYNANELKFLPSLPLINLLTFMCSIQEANKASLAEDVSCPSCQVPSKPQHRNQRLPAPPSHPQATSPWCPRMPIPP